MNSKPEPPEGAEPVVRVGRKGAPPAPHETLGALAAPAPARPRKSAKVLALKSPVAREPATASKRSERTKALNFNVTANFRKAFKLAAEARNCKKVELLELMFEEWQNRHLV